jgi:hypothetical protein
LTKPETQPADRSPSGGIPIAPDDPASRTNWQASWLRDPVFKGVPYRELIDPDRKPENNGALLNVHTLFRRELTLADRPIRRARLYITADDCYKLTLNGDFIGTGPAPAYPSGFPYNAWDVTASLRPGSVNCIGVHTFYHGMHSLTFPSGDNLQGLLLQLEIDFADQPAPSPPQVILVSDDQWRCHQTDAYESRQIYGYQTAFSEHIDLRKLPQGWNQAGFDDSRWDRPLSGKTPDCYSLSPQQTPPVAVFMRWPVRIVQKGPGHYFIDFGSELTGQTAFQVTGQAGHEVEIRHGEETEGPDSVRYKMRCNCLYQEFCTLSGRPNETLEFFDYKGFRYVEVLNWPEPLSTNRIWAYERHYPFPEEASRFTSSNPLLNDIWTLCRNGVRVGTQDTYLDCPTREKGGFMGDGFVTGISHLVLTGDARILEKFIRDVASTGRYSPGLFSTAPNYINGQLVEYSLLWPVLLEYYHQWTGDLQFVREMMPVLEKLLHYYGGYENDSGLLQDLFDRSTGKYSVLVDWPANLRDGYDDPILMGGGNKQKPEAPLVNTMVQGFYSCALQSAERLAGITGEHGIGQWLDGRKERLQAAVLRELRDPQTGLFVDRTGSVHSALHANVTPLMAGMLAPGNRQNVLEFIRGKRLNCGVYFSFFVLKALYDAGEHELAYELMTSRDRHSWNSMLEAGATTCMEAWAPDLKWNTSWCHPWSSAPIHMIAHELMGLRPQSPGWKAIRFAPRPPAGLASAAITITTPQGQVQAAFDQTLNTITYRLTIPPGCTATCAFIASDASVSINGSQVACRSQRDKRGIPCMELVNQLGNGEHTIQVCGRCR